MESMLNTISEVVTFDHCPLEWHWKYNRGRTILNRSMERGKLIHDLFSISCNVDKKLASDLISKIERGNSIDINREITKSKIADAYLQDIFNYNNKFVFLNDEQVDKLKNIFIHTKSEFEAKRFHEIFYSNLNSKKAFDGIYVKAMVNPEIISKKTNLIGRPDKIEFHEGQSVPVEMKLDGFLDSIVKRQMQGEIILARELGDSRKSLLYLFFPKKMIEYEPSEGELYEFQFISDLMSNLKKKNEILAKEIIEEFNVKPGRMKKCRYSEYYERCSPCLEEAVERRGEIVARKDENGEYIIGRRRTIGIEGMLTQIAIDNGNTKLKEARIKEEFKPLRYWTKEKNITGLESELRWMERQANDYSTLRLFTILFLGLEDNKERSISTISAYTHISPTSISTLLKIAKNLGWVREQEIINPINRKRTVVYRRKKQHEMVGKEQKALNEFKEEMMQKLRECGTPYTTFLKKIFKAREKALKEKGLIQSVGIASSRFPFEHVTNLRSSIQITEPLDLK
ncbi:MAG: PD-(D/E)XK nuclease family protein [Candidatus Parvarchaeota archaeon]|nr:PD-(D/E)XK nuclease family protein [Candidatus Jingweiarchaeum tengchongense]MCW1297810.1 PD-(D/E)XK nuclease family protein [Candidatus Jingweiarchaeum tengchongense]MCW1299820.1 PD-(D/E)XK nuclease family protein [Candidatus Jingweiarchaeum tengchongense]MCW1304209.1 PD-(D/E)XK nuclease family protein [Candidatus Jingweiarchaeum tengchongense]MCW1305237.1 PD-(D/E)XK nuclease family protein [Candidatus Jingweiarchaeum tengchongense]